jgi:molybdate transport system substrate-binding protein
MRPACIRRRFVLATPILFITACGNSPPQPLTVAAAANLTDVFDQVGKEFTAETHIPVVFTYGPTATLARQVEAKAPFDVFAAADQEHVDSLVKSGRIVPGTNFVYARGQLALWAPQGGVQQLNDLIQPRIKYIAIAQPELAPYGQAAVEALKGADLWDLVHPKLVYANNISQARQLAASGNADVAFTAYSLVLHDNGSILKIDPALHSPIDQTIGVVAGSGHESDGRKFVDFVMGPRGAAILTKNGYLR